MPDEPINNIVRTNICAGIIVPPPPLTFELGTPLNDGTGRIRYSIRDISDATLREIGKRYGEMLVEMSAALKKQAAPAAQKDTP